MLNKETHKSKESEARQAVDGVIYLLTFPNGKGYVGQSWDFDRRMSRYRLGDCAKQRLLHNALKKHGWGSVKVKTLQSGIGSQDALNAWEIMGIAAHGTLAPLGYNLQGGGATGKHSAETRARISVAAKASNARPDVKAKISAANKAAQSRPETKAKQRAANKAAWSDPALRARQRATVEAAWARPEVKARFMAARARPEYRAAQRAAMKALWQDPDYRRRQIAARKGRQRHG